MFNDRCSSPICLRVRVMYQFPDPMKSSVARIVQVGLTQTTATLMLKARGVQHNCAAICFAI